jgi:hypothetical protein
LACFTYEVECCICCSLLKKYFHINVTQSSNSGICIALKITGGSHKKQKQNVSKTMANIAKTVGSFDKVLASCKTIGAQYQPNVPELSPAALSQLHDRAQQSLGVVTMTRIAYQMAVNNRKESFARIPTLASRIVRMMSVCSRGDTVHLQDAVRIKNKLYARGKSQNPVEHKTTDTSEVAQATRSSGRMSFDQQMETFSNLVALAGKMSNYNPLEADLTLSALQQTLRDLHDRSHEVAEAYAAFRKARLERDQMIGGHDGILQITKAVRNYIHGAFGSQGYEAHQIKGM